MRFFPISNEDISEFVLYILLLAIPDFIQINILAEGDWRGESAPEGRMYYRQQSSELSRPGSIRSRLSPSGSLYGQEESLQKQIIC